MKCKSTRNMKRKKGSLLSCIGLEQLKHLIKNQLKALKILFITNLNVIVTIKFQFSSDELLCQKYIKCNTQVVMLNVLVIS